MLTPVLSLLLLWFHGTLSQGVLLDVRQREPKSGPEMNKINKKFFLETVQIESFLDVITTSRLLVFLEILPHFQKT